ncbi:MAG: zf-HC2 domain-containing protein, partial [Planctomycetota bacterium]|nr:zf-HC2 domain-containing protein [Planctomycetota bacterium]
MLCDQVREHLSAYLDRELTADLSAAVRAHLDACAECRALADDLRATVDLLGRLPARPAPGHLTDDVMREIERRGILAVGAAIEPPPQERTLPMRRARLWPRALAVAATLALAIGIGIFAYLSEVGGPKASQPGSGVADKAADEWKEKGRDLYVTMAPKSAEFYEEEVNGRRMAPTASAAARSSTDADLQAGWAKTAQADKAPTWSMEMDREGVVPARDRANRFTRAREEKPAQSALLSKVGNGTLTLADASAYGTLDFNGGSLGRTYNLEGDGTKVTSLNWTDLRFNDSDALEQLQVGNGTISGTMNLAGANTYTGGNTYTGDTFINGGTLQVVSANGRLIQAPTAVSSYSVAGLNGGTNTMYFGEQPAAGGSAGRARDLGTITLNGDNTYGYSDGTIISAGVAMAPEKAPIPAPAPTAAAVELLVVTAAPPPAAAPARAQLAAVPAARPLGEPAPSARPAAAPAPTQVAAAPAAPSASKPAQPARPAAKAGVVARGEIAALSDSDVTLGARMRGKASGHGTAADGSEALEQAMKAAAWGEGDGDGDQLSRAATQDALGRAGNQLVIQAESPAEADQGLVELFKAAGWQSLASDRSGRKAKLATPQMQYEGVEKRSDPAAQKEPSEEFDQSAAAGRYYIPAAAGVYYKAVRNGENVWLVLADRDSISRFGSRLAQARGLTVAAESSSEFRAIRGLQDQLRQWEFAKANQPAQRLAGGKEVAGGDAAAAFARPPAPAKPPAGRPAGEADPSAASGEGEKPALKTAKVLDEGSKDAAKKTALPPPSATPPAAEQRKA